MASEEFGPYILEDVLGRGGMGVVYRAFDTRRDRIVALKRLPRHLAEDETFQARFRRESRMAARLNEPHIIPIHDFGEIDGQLYIDMRLVEGSDLSNLISADSGLTPERSVDIVGQIAAALHSAHTAGLVHRDIKPSNVLVTGAQNEDETPFAYLVDFGIARAMVGEAGTSLTATTGTVGTLAYMAPERISGAPGDSRSDIYSLACVLYECLVGRAPFLGEAFQVMFAHVNSEPPTASQARSGVSPGLDAVIARGMAKDPDERFETTTQFAAAARRALSGRAGVSDRAGPDTPTLPRPLPLATTPGPNPTGGAPTSGAQLPPPTTPPVDRTPPPGSEYGPARHSGPVQPAARQSPQSGPLPDRPGVVRPAAAAADLAGRPTLRTGGAGGSAPPGNAAVPSQTGPQSGGPPAGTGPTDRPGSGAPPNRPPTSGTGSHHGFADTGAAPPHIPTQRSGRGGGGIGDNKRTLIIIAAVTLLVLAIGVVIVVAVRGGGGSSSADPTGVSSPVSGGSSSPDFPSSGATTPSTSGSAAGWAPYASFTELIGATPGDTSTSFLGATCQLQPPDAEVTGMIDKVACTKLTGTKVVYYVARFDSAKDVSTYLDGLVTKSKYNRSYWTISDQRRGLLVTSPSSAKFADVTSSICELPTFLVEFYADSSANLTESQVEGSYWKRSSFPNTTPAVCQ